MQLEPWIETFTGKQLYFLDPQEDQIDIEDIATALSNECRFGGHTASFYSVAEHSVLVASLCPKELQLMGLLHDASEAYLRDIVSPIKQYLPDYKKIEDRLMGVIASKFSFAYPLAPEIKEADKMALKCEARQLLPSKGKAWIQFFPTVKECTNKLHCFPPHVVKQLFINAFHDLTKTKPAIWVPKSEIVLAR